MSSSFSSVSFNTSFNRSLYFSCFSITLFALYIANRDFVLRLVSNVLNCRCTTSDVLRYISTMDIERLYETGLEEFNYSI